MTMIGPTNPQNNQFPQPVTYRPGVPQGTPVTYNPALGRPDAYQPGYPRPGMPMQPGNPAGQPKDNYQYVAQKDVAFGILGAVGGFFAAGLVGLSGPIGALILGAAFLAISAIGRAISHNKQSKQQQQMPQQPGGMPQAPQYPYPTQGANQAIQYQNQYNNTQMTPQQGMPQPGYPQQAQNQQFQPGMQAQNMYQQQPQNRSMWDKFLSIF